MKLLNVAVSAFALASTGLVGASTAQAKSLSDQEAVRLSFAALQNHADRYGIESASGEFRLGNIVRDSLGQTHVRMNQVYKGIPVMGETLVTHFNGRGELTYLNGSYTPMYDLSVRPSLSAERALDIARFDFDHEESVEPTARLKILINEDGDAVLAWHIELVDIDSNDPKAWTYFVDARNGDIVLDFDSLQTIAAEGTGKTLYLGTVNITTDKGTTSYTMKDPTRGDMYITDMKNGTSGNGTAMTDADNVWGSGANTDRASAAADAHFGSEMTWDLFKGLGRNGIANNGKGSLSRVHYGNRYNNAFWSDSCFCMTYGDGDGTNLSPLVSIDVAGHEMAHGVTSTTSGLTYSGQSGGLNESFSDMMGTAVEFYAVGKGANTKAEYWIGEDIYTPSKVGDALRYMDQPSKDGRSIDHASKMTRFMDVHYSSGVANNQFYLLAMGGTNKTSGISVVGGVGIDKATAIWFRANTSYFTASTTWAQARTLTDKACKDLYGLTGPECTVNLKAWEAVGVK